MANELWQCSCNATFDSHGAAVRHQAVRKAIFDGKKHRIKKIR